MRKFVILFLLVALAALLAAPTLAQDTVIAEGFNSPRGIAYDSTGNLYVVEAGSGGDLSIAGTFGPIPVGGTGALKRVDRDGRIETLVQNLPSQGPANSARGAQDVIITDDAVWLLIGQTPQGLPLSQSLLKLDPEFYRVQTVADLYAIEAGQNPDGDIVESNPTGVVMTEDGTFYIADASCNCIETWSEGGEVEVFTWWDVDDNPVPTGIALGNDNDLYVGFLSGFPFDEGRARIEHWSLDGELLETFGGLTAIVEVLVGDDGSVYAVQHGVFGDDGWLPGQVIRVSAEGAETVLGNLNRPWGLAFTPEGDLAVSINSVSTDGAVIRIPMGN